MGGGIIGCSVAYHLTLRGWTDVVLLERHTLTSGTTWHAAGLVGQVRATHNMTRLASYSAELYEQLEADGRGDEVPDAGFEIQVAGRRVASTVSYRAFYDPTNSRIRA